MMGRYDTSGNIQAEFEPGSNDTVLRNKLGVTNESEIADIELSLLVLLYEALIESVRVDQPLTVNDLCDWHRRWLGNVYDVGGRVSFGEHGQGKFSVCSLWPDTAFNGRSGQ